MRANLGIRAPSRTTMTAATLAVVVAAAVGTPSARGAVMTYSSSPNLFVPDGSPGETVSDTITVPDDGTLNDLDVKLTLHHPQTADVTIDLVDPSGLIRVRVFNRDLGVGDGVINVTFDDEAGGPPPDFDVNGTCRENVSFQADGLLSDFDGQPIAGTWTLEVTDHAASDAVDCDCDGFVVGPPCPRTLEQWSLILDFDPTVDADLSITKTDGLAVVDQGGHLTYTIVAANGGPGDVTGAAVADTFPADLDCTWTCSASAGSSCTAAGPVAGDIVTTADLLAGGSATYTATCAVAADATGTLSNTATVSAPGGVDDPDPSNDSDGDDTDVNETPVAQCRDVTVEGDQVTCTADADVDDGSFDPDGDPLTLSQSPPGPYGLGDTLVTLTASDGSLSDDCQGTVTVIDGAAPVIHCNAPATIVAPDAPISFTATASDACGPANAAVTAYDCFAFTKKGRRIDKTASCAVSFDGDTVTIHDSGGVGATITWDVTATDGSGNSITMTCSVEVIRPGS